MSLTTDYDHGSAVSVAESLAQVRAHVEALVGRLDSLASDQISKKQAIEDRWITDLRQYHGKYEANVETALAQEKKSRLFINETRSKTHAWEARLSDMLFPTDDDNWGLKPTPVPEVMGAQSLIEPGSDADAQLKQIQKLALARSEAMQAEIKDQLVEAQYNLKARDIIHDATKVGTGIFKGPVVENRTRRRYEQINYIDDEGNLATTTDGQPKRVWRLVQGEDQRPSWERTDYFNYFPDMSARHVREAEFHYERHLMTKKEMKRLARKRGFDADAIRQIVIGSPREQTPDYMAKLRDVAGTDQASIGEKYHVWEYHGPIEAEEARAVAEFLPDGAIKTTLLNQLASADPLEEHECVVWFCEGHLLKFGLPLLETGDPPYSVFCFEQDDTNIFGFGIPYLMRDSQAAMNAAWRMSMDNAGLSVGPQVVINTEILEPVNGVWELEPRKLWRQHKNLPYPVTAFDAFHIDSRQAELANIIEMAKNFANDEVNMPDIAQGEIGSSPRQTAQGMSMLMNSVNVVFRRVVKNFDDDVTVPNIRRSYDWNMAFNKKEHIKGDMNVDARGSSVLLVRELQAQNLMTMALQFTNHAALGPLTKVAPMYRKLVQAHMLPADELVLTDQEVKQKEREDAGKPPDPDPEMLKLEAQLNISTVESQTKIQIAGMQQETAMITLAEKRNMSDEQLAAKLEAVRMTVASAERKLAAEIAEARRHPEKQTGGSV